MAIGQRIKAARELAGMSREQLAEHLGVSPKSIANWETGRTQPQNKVAVIENLLGVDLSEQPATTTSPTLAQATDAQIATELVNRLAQLRREAAQHAQEIAESQQSQGSQTSSSGRTGAPNTPAPDSIGARELAVQQALPDMTHALEGGASTQKKRTGDR